MKRSNKPVAAMGAEMVEGRPVTKGNSLQPTVTGTQSLGQTSSGLTRVRDAARKDRKLRFTSVLHHLTPECLRDAYGSLKRDAAPGVDGMTWAAYGENLPERIADLHARVHSGRYRAQPSRRTWIPKADGQQRPLGIAALEDKIVQMAAVWVLQAIYEEDFAGFSYGFRPTRSQHHALDAVWVGISQRPVNWVLDADIRRFFDTIDHAWLLQFLRHRIADERMLRLITKWLRAGVMEDGQWSQTQVGTPQGAVISPLLANIYLHYVLDQWIAWWRRHHANGAIIVVRYADDFVMGFEHRSDAERLLAAMRERFARFGLALHDEKTRLIEFGKMAAASRARRGERRPETFNFLGFTHICGKTKDGQRFLLLRKTMKERQRRIIAHITAGLRARWHASAAEQGTWLGAVLRGVFGYYAVPTNGRGVDSLRRRVIYAWRTRLMRRSQKGKATWEWMAELARKWLPPTRILHPYPTQRLCIANHPR